MQKPREYSNQSLVIVVEQRRKKTKNGLHTFAFSCLPRGFWALVHV